MGAFQSIFNLTKDIFNQGTESIGEFLSLLPEASQQSEATGTDTTHENMPMRSRRITTTAEEVERDQILAAAEEFERQLTVNAPPLPPHGRREVSSPDSREGQVVNTVDNQVVGNRRRHRKGGPSMLLQRSKVMLVRHSLVLLCSMLAIATSWMLHVDESNVDEGFTIANSASNGEERSMYSSVMTERIDSSIVPEVPEYAMMEDVPVEEFHPQASVGSEFLSSLDEALHNNVGKSSIGKMNIYSGFMHVRTFNVDEITKEIRKTVEAFDGYIESSSYGSSNASFETRIPSYSFFDFLDEIITIAGKEFVTFHTTVKDKTKAYVEAVTRTETLDATYKALRKLLERANSVNEILQINREIDILTSKIETAKRQALTIKEHEMMSSIVIRISLDKHTSKKPMSVPWDPLKTVWKAARQLVNFAMILTDFTIYFLVFFVPISIVSRIGQRLGLPKISHSTTGTIDSPDNPTIAYSEHASS